MNFKQTKFDFVKHRNKFFLLSSVLIAAGMIVLFLFGLNLGIDFTSGSRVEILSKEPLEAAEIKADFENLQLKPESVVLSGENEKRAAARFKEELEKNEVLKIKDYFQEKYGFAPNVSTVSPQVGRDLAQNAMIAVALSTIVIIIYVWIRFEFLQGLATIVALLHDTFFIIAVFSLLQLEVNIPYIAAVLTIVGYSVNDTIVTFDRVRENMRLAKKVRGFTDLADIVNRSIHQTLTRSIITTVTTLIAAIALLLFGSEAIRNFALALTVGLISGVYSSIFIACQLWVVWKAKHMKRKRNKPHPSQV